MPVKENTLKVTKCLNCGHHLKGKFCSNCGQKASVKRLTISALFDEAIHFFTHLQKGFLFTSGNFLIRPGISSLKYISGKRKDYQTPVSFFLIWIGLFSFLHNTIISRYHLRLSEELFSEINIREQSNILFRHHFALFLIPVIIFSAFLIYYIMARPLYNFIELLTLSLYGAGIYFMMSFMSDLILGFVFRVNILSTNVFLWQATMSMFYNFWFNFDFFKRLNLRLFWIRLIGVSILIASIGWFMMFYLPMAWIYFLRIFQ